MISKILFSATIIFNCLNLFGQEELIHPHYKYPDINNDKVSIITFFEDRGLKGELKLVVFPTLKEIENIIKKTHPSLHGRELYIKFNVQKDHQIELVELFFLPEYNQLEDIEKLIMDIFDYAVLNKDFYIMGEFYELMIILKI